MSKEEVGQRIKKLRELQNYTRESFAEKIDISSKFLYEIETGKKGFSAEVLCRISEALVVSCDYIMYGMEGKNAENFSCVLEQMEPKQISRVFDILEMLCAMNDSLRQK